MTDLDAYALPADDWHDIRQALIIAAYHAERRAASFDTFAEQWPDGAAHYRELAEADRRDVAAYKRLELELAK